MNGNTWKKLFRQTTMNNYRALQLLHKKNNQVLHLNLPLDLKTDKEILKFSKQITKTISFPELQSITNNS